MWLCYAQLTDSSAENGNMDSVFKRLVLLSCMFAMPGLSWALSFGEISSNSYLNQRLDAEVKLYSLNPSEVIDARVTLASKEAHDRAGINMNYILQKLRFNIVSKGNNEFVVKVVTKKAVKEPVIEFVLELDWATGRVQRAFSLHLDPPPL
jgi:pilus assembly protein FimV